MNTCTHPASVGFIRTLMNELPFPVKDLFIDGYNGEHSGADRPDEANPFRPLFALMRKLDDDCEEARNLNRIFERKRHRAAGTPPCVTKRNAELDDDIKAAICDMRRLLRPEHQGVLDGLASRRFFVAVSDADRSLRQIKLTLGWNEAEFRRQQGRKGGAR